MMGAPSMRSAVLPAVSYLDAARVRFLVRLWVWGKNRAEALFDGRGGILRSLNRYNSNLFLDLRDREEGKDLAAWSSSPVGRSG